MKWLKRLFRSKKTAKPEKKMAMTSDQAEKMLRMIEHTQAEELSCDEVFDLLDVYAEMAARGEDVGELYPLVEHHLEMCPDCREEYEAVMRILEQRTE
ncbi:MAG: hypothetical protein P1P73_02810 [Brevefilum sp.]|nr:hypothetical protein [Brevefilum sp.]MDW7755122.1 hypothetical protein [Brevefilum sp.]